MNGWRNDVAIIREITVGTPSAGWRNDWMAIARFLGREPTGWRDAVGLWAQDNGVTANNWRDSIVGVAQILVDGKPRSWRNSVSIIRKHYEGNPPSPTDALFFINELPRKPNTRYLVLANGVIEYDKFIFA